jgi:hypothetical protein
MTVVFFFILQFIPPTFIVYLTVHVTMWLMEIKQIWLCLQPKNKRHKERLISRRALVFFIP